MVTFHRHTLLPLDDCLCALRPSLPHLTRSSLHRCLQRHGISRLPEVEGDKPGKRKFRTYPIGSFHIDVAEVRTGDGKLYLFVTIDGTSKLAIARLAHMADRQSATEFLDAVIEAVPYRIHTVLTDNGTQLTHKPGTSTYRMHAFDRVCLANKIEHRLTQPNHPWTTDEIEQPFLIEAAIFRLPMDDHAAKSRI